jgi:hypothetical protein
MKKILHLILGIIIILTLFIALSGLYIKFEKSKILILIGVLYFHSIVALIVHKYLKNKQIRIGSWIASFVCIFLIIIFIEQEVSNLKTLKNRTVYESVDKLQLRERIMKNSDLSLGNKVNQLGLNHITKDRIFIIQSYPIDKNKKQNKTSSLLISGLRIEKYHNRAKVITHNDSIFHFQTNQGGDVKIRLQSPERGDSIVLVGYLPNMQMYLIAESVSESGIDYKTIDIENGIMYNGIPVWSNSNKKYFSFVQFRHSLGYLEISIKHWERDKKGFLTLIYDEIIPTGQYLDNYDDLYYSISDFKWSESTFSFILSNFYNVTTESTLIKTKIIEYKMD